MMQQAFAEKVKTLVEKDPAVIGLAVAGSWTEAELDEYADLDLVLVTSKRVGGDKEQMMEYANRFGKLLTAFTGEHVGESRLLICLYDDPLLHVDIKFVTLDEFGERVEDPAVLFERDAALSSIISTTKPQWPQPDFQWIEDRFWTWIHYLACKAARGEFFECLDGITFMRAKVIAPLLQLKSKTKPRGVRKVETKLSAPDLESLKITNVQYNKASIFKAMDNMISVYRSLRRKLFPDTIELRELAEKRTMDFFRKLAKN